ncbi:hypothetical protein [Paenibacillus oralis]|uniref:hypothetical protein n=1 Tax=Paenibacillus oralis TaxID=2490856 RepID=UPI0015AA4FE0|nr:hypothetical protein [Paenibacillus oralis]
MNPKKIISSAGVAIALGMIFMTMMLNSMTMFIVSLVLIVVLAIIYFLVGRQK